MRGARDPDAYRALEIKTLGKQRDAEVKDLLTRAAKQVQPIMRRKKWTVRVLSEFYPNSDNLLGLNVNRGQQVKVRVRLPGRVNQFYPFEAIMGTLLHELTHNEIGPHNSSFYKLLDEITEECESLMARGVSGSGSGFDAASSGRLGGSDVPVNPSLEARRQVALDAANERIKKQNLKNRGGRRLGGDSRAAKGLAPAQAAALAAHRRARDDMWCGGDDQSDDVEIVKIVEAEVLHVSPPPPPPPNEPAPQDGGGGADGHCSRPGIVSLRGIRCQCCVRAGGGDSPQRCTSEGFKRRRCQLSQASLPDTNNKAAAGKDDPLVLDLTGSDDELGEASTNAAASPPRTTGQAADQVMSNTAYRAGRDSASSSVNSKGQSSSISRVQNTVGTSWACGLCTLLNGETSQQCAACESPRELRTGTRTKSSTSRTWQCKFCNVQNDSPASHCAGCTQWRYSFGPPMVSRPTLPGED
mmetsp:Transcript_3432/g.6785  ORF Transcript_3432/g.6785 Transcript_3432/m.6785 type:complete len:470 (+) Transcript_3432:359-1768(+)